MNQCIISQRWEKENSIIICRIAASPCGLWAGYDGVQVTTSSHGPASDIRLWSPGYRLVTVGQTPWVFSHSLANLPEIQKQVKLVCVVNKVVTRDSLGLLCGCERPEHVTKIPEQKQRRERPGQIRVDRSANHRKWEVLCDKPESEMLRFLVFTLWTLLVSLSDNFRMVSHHLLLIVIALYVQKVK